MHATRFSSHSTGARRYPLSYVLSGLYLWSNGNLYDQDSYGRWWSTAAYSGSNAYHLSMLSSNLDPQSNLNKAYGFPLRCVSLGFTFSRRYPLSYVLSGYYQWYDGNLNTQEYGNWSSATAKNDNQIYTITMSIVSNGANPQNYHHKVLGSALHSTPARRYPLSYVFSGNYGWTSSTGDGVLNMQGSISRFWSSIAVDTGYATSLRLYESTAYVSPQWSDTKMVGASLRCVSVSNTARRYPLSYVYSGYYGWWDGNLDTQGSRGIFWSATTNGNAQAYRLSVWTNLDTLSISGMTQGNPLRFTNNPSVSAFVCVVRRLRLGQW